MFLVSGLLSLAMLGFQVTPQECNSCHSVDQARFEASVHAGLGCSGCHSAITRLPHADKPKKVDCSPCHADTVKLYTKSVHGLAQKAGVSDAAVCLSCHGDAHLIVKSSDPASKVAKNNLADTCGSCHSNPDFLSRHKIPFAKPVEAYRLSVHGRAVAKGNLGAASCSDCHGSHDIHSGKDASSSTQHRKVAETCGKCHPDVEAVYEQSVHGIAVKNGAEGAPECTDCHGEHSILAPSEAGSLVNPARVSTVTCGRCHADERLAARYALPSDKLPAFQDSYHGLALRGGAQTVANCASCHGIHNILPSKDPRSTVNPANLGQTCGRCHPGVGKRFAIGPVHVRSATGSEHAVVRWIRLTYLLLIPLTIGFMLFHNGIDLLRKLRHRRASHGENGQFKRMNLNFRVAHWMVVPSFLMLILTGFALKFPEADWVKLFNSFDPTSAYRGLAHRIAAIVLMVGSAYHALHLAMERKDRVILRELLPSLQDAKDILGMIRYNLGLTRVRPTFGMFGYPEKMEYWAYWWGTFVMAATGLLLWAENWSLKYFPKWVMDAATAAHWYEAILASLSILVWHWYLVIFDPDVYPMDMAWLTGKVPAEHIRETRPEYYRQAMAKLEGEATAETDETGEV